MNDLSKSKGMSSKGEVFPWVAAMPAIAICFPASSDFSVSVTISPGLPVGVSVEEGADTPASGPVPVASTSSFFAHPMANTKTTDRPPSIHFFPGNPFMIILPTVIEVWCDPILQHPLRSGQCRGDQEGDPTPDSPLKRPFCQRPSTDVIFNSE